MRKVQLRPDCAFGTDMGWNLVRGADGGRRDACVLIGRAFSWETSKIQHGKGHALALWNRRSSGAGWFD